MKKKILSGMLVFCLINATQMALGCACLFADCGTPSSAAHSATPLCHHKTTSAKEKARSKGDCCGKCQIEKTAVFSKELFYFGDFSGKNIPAISAVTTDVFQQSRLSAALQIRFHSPPPQFFINRIFPSALSFRAPPQG